MLILSVKQITQLLHLTAKLVRVKSLSTIPTRFWPTLADHIVKNGHQPHIDQNFRYTNQNSVQRGKRAKL